MHKTEHIPPLPTSQEMLASYERAFRTLRTITLLKLNGNGFRAADALDAAVLLVPGRFTLGQIVATPGALGTLERAEHLPAEFLLRHKSGDWGERDPDDLQVNEEALLSRGRIVSVYQTRLQDSLWLITDAGWEVTTLLLPEEY